ncbi:M3 family peptidase [Prolixibacteraceae bacterium JC049]|nr:M3 family peptidase [Prolixibacteraceae bacterium JC049]
MKKLIVALAITTGLSACNKTGKMEDQNTNPLLSEFTTPHKTAPFDKIKTEHYLPAFKQLIAEAEAKIDELTAQKEAPTFENTIVPMEVGDEKLGRASSVFFNLNSANTNDEMQQLAQELSPMLTEFSSKMLMNAKLFERVKAVYNDLEKGNYTPEQKMVVTKHYKAFVRNGANLKDADKKRFAAIKSELSKLTIQFSNNVLAETNAFFMHVEDEKELAGLPEFAKQAAAQEAKKRELKGWVFTLQYPSFGPFMKFAENRALREKMYRAYTSRANHNDDKDNKELVRKIANLRLELAQIMGAKSYAEYVLTERMAETPKRVNDFISQLHTASRPFAMKEYAAVQAYAKKNGANFEIQRWDWSFYADKLKEEKYGINDEMIKPYFELNKVKEGIFELTKRLYGLTFKSVDNIAKYHEEVQTYEVYEANGDFLSVLYMDFFPRESKQGGAWMTDYRSQSNVAGKSVRPHISVVCNFTKPTETTPSLLTFDEVTTFLHEFGHALHGMLSKCVYPTVSGTSVYRDFVELPSQVLENWATQKEWLDLFAVHYKTGEKIPASLIQKIIDAENFNAGYLSERQLSFGMLDMAWHTIEQPFTDDVTEFEEKAMSKTELFDPIKGSAMSPAFSHIFAGGYAAGYYGYKWAEVLDADAFAAFKENGIYDKATADKFRTNILEKGGSEHPMKLYVQFRGQEPTVDALLDRSGLK